MIIVSLSLINLLFVRLLYEIIWLTISTLCVFVITKYLTPHWCIVFDYYGKQNINYKTYLSVFTIIKIAYTNMSGCYTKKYCYRMEFGAIGIINKCIQREVKKNVIIQGDIFQGDITKLIEGKHVPRIISVCV